MPPRRTSSSRGRFARAPAAHDDGAYDVDAARGGSSASSSDEDGPPAPSGKPADVVRRALDSRKQRLRERQLGARPAATKRVFGSHVGEYLRWCKDNGHDDLPTDELLAEYLEAHLSKRLKRKASRADANDETLSLRSIKGHVTAICDYWRWREKPAGSPSPRGQCVKALLYLMSHEEEGKRCAEYADRLDNTFVEGYTKQDRANLCNYYLSKGSFVGDRSRAMHTLQYALVCRGDNTRRIQLADLVANLMEVRSGGRQYVGGVVIMRQGKENQRGRPEKTGFLRAKDWLTCPFNATATFLFRRWHVEYERRPDYSTRPSWYDLYLFCHHDNPLQQISYDQHHVTVREAHKQVNIFSKKSTHLERGHAPRELRDKGISREELRAHGHWYQDSLGGAYLTNLSYQCMFALAGFHPLEGDYTIPRAAVKPPENLLRQIFPWVEDELEKANERARHEATRDLACVYHLMLLMEFRNVLLQDAPFMMLNHPDHPVLQHPIFTSHEFKVFAREVLRHEEQCNADQNTHLAASSTAELLHSILLRVKVLTDAVNIMIGEYNERDVACLELTRAQLSQLSLEVPRILHPSGEITTRLHQREPQTIHRAGIGRAILPKPASVFNSTQPHHGDTNLCAPASLSTLNDLGTVRALWDYYHTHIPEMERKFGSQFRSAERERAQMYRYRSIIDAVKQRIRRAGVEGAIAEVEMIRLNCKSGTMNQLSEHLRSKKLKHASTKSRS